MYQLPHKHHVDLNDRRHVIKSQRQLVEPEVRFKRQQRDHRKRQKAPLTDQDLAKLSQLCPCGQASVVVDQIGVCALCHWIRGVCSDQVENIALQQGKTLGPQHLVKPSYYQWRNAHKPEPMSKADWDRLELTNCELCHQRSWHNHWNRPEKRSKWVNLCKCCALISEPFPSLTECRDHIAGLFNTWISSGPEILAEQGGQSIV